MSRRVVFLEVLVWINRNFTYLYSDKRFGYWTSITVPHLVYEKTKKMSQKCRVALVRSSANGRITGKNSSYEGRFIATKVLFEK